MFNPEKNIIDKKIEIDQLYQIAQKELVHDEIPLDDFYNTPGYNNEEIDRDKKFVKEKEKQFRNQDSQLAEEKEFEKIARIFEYVFYQQAELSNWLGDQTRTIKTSRYDDIKNGVDVIAEFQNNSDEYLGIAIDVTTSNDFQGKFRRIKDKIKDGHFTEIKYFQSEESEKRRIANIPKIIIGANRKTVLELAELQAEKKNKKLADHFIQFQILEEIIIQSKMFEKYAEKENQPQISNAYRKIKIIAENILKEKKNKILSVFKKRDEFFRIMKNYLSE